MAPDTSAPGAAIAPLAVRIGPVLLDVLGAEPRSKNPNSKPWIETFKAYIQAGKANPELKMEYGRWVHNIRSQQKHQTPARSLVLQGVAGFQYFPSAASQWLGRGYLVQYGQQHAHTCVPQDVLVDHYRLGQYVYIVRRAAGGKCNWRFDPTDWAWFEYCIRGWAWKAIGGFGAEAFRQSLEQRQETAEHHWWYRWAKAYLHRYHNFAFSLMTADEVASVLGEDVWVWLVPFLANPAREITSWPQETALLRGRAIAMLELVPPAGCKPEWLPEHSLGRRVLNNPALLKLAEYLNSRWHRT